MIESLLQICENLVIMHENSDGGNLYSKEYSHDNQITRAASVINQTCFYGRSIGFQYVESLKSLFRFLAVALASFSESYYMKGAMALKTTNYFLKQPTYFMDPELCARRIMNVSRNCDVKFCKVSDKTFLITREKIKNVSFSSHGGGWQSQSLCKSFLNLSVIKLR